MKVLLSIKPEFVHKIFSGEKRYEFRRVIFKRPDISVVVVYASSPVQKVVGEFTIERILSDHPTSLWKRTHKYSGITEEFFFAYFGDKNHGFAIKIGNVKKYKKELSLRRHLGVLPPQSYAYLS